MIRRADLLNLSRGLLMGGADIVPGVSGGTVALILGIYRRLVTAISHVDATLLGHLKGRRWRDAAHHLDLRFLIALGLGIGTGVVGLASLMHHLLNNELQHTMAAFFGMILASSLLVARMVPRWTPGAAIGGVVGAVGAFLLVGLPLLQDPPEGHGFLFLCGAIAICAMILPGVSGAFLLLVLGQYERVTGVLKDLAQGALTGEGIAIVATFGAGAVVGILSFSKFLRWLLARHEAMTLAVLGGFMVGSLRKIWPFRVDLTPTVEKLRDKEFDYVVPDLGDTSTWLSLGILVVAAVFVLAVDRLAGGVDPEAARVPDEAPGPS